MVVGDKLKRATASLSCNITVPNTEVKQFKGILNRNLSAVSTFTANFRVDYNSNLGTLAATSSVYARPVQQQIAEAAMISSSSLSASANVLQTATDMVLIFNVQNTGAFPRKVYLPFDGTVNVTVNWGDGENSSYNSRGLIEHTYATTGTKTVIVTRNSQSGTALGTFGMYKFGNAEGSGDQFVGPLPNRGWLTEITSFGNLGITRLANIDSGVFTGLSNVPSFLPPSVTSLKSCRLTNNFSGAASWNPVNVQDFTQLFFFTDWNRDISYWDVSSATTMTGMFQGNTVFNQNISSWNVSNVTNMSFMFYGASSFNQNINSWNTGSVTTMYAMFGTGTSMAFNQPLNSWNVSNVTTMQSMFGGGPDTSALPFNQPLNNWNVSKVTNMQSMFYNCASYDQDISGWSVRPRITTKPTGFDTGTPASWTTAEKPNWGV
jgi:surface protein